MIKSYGGCPENIGIINLEISEMMAYLYLPIKFPFDDFSIEPRLSFLIPIIQRIKQREKSIEDMYVYATVKNLFCTKDNPGNRPGWHSDGFLSDDINYIWSDKYPTIFCIQDFNITNNHLVSMEEFKKQAMKENEYSFPEKSLLRLTEEHIHRTPCIETPGMRAFIKISISKERYNLEGNSHNYNLGYKWKMYKRDELRNHPVYMERDFINEDFGVRE